MIMVSVDDETIELMEGAALTLEQALAARARRMDPDGIISRSFEMSRIKTAEFIRQCRRPPPRPWSDYNAEEKAQVHFFASSLAACEDATDAEFLMRKLRAALFRYHESPPLPPHGEWLSQSLADRLEDENAPTNTAKNKAAVQRVRKESGKKPAPRASVG